MGSGQCMLSERGIWSGLGIASLCCALAWLRMDRIKQLWLHAAGECSFAWLSLSLKQSSAAKASTLWAEASSCSDIDIPDEFKDPISLSVILEPVVLCATGQIYCYRTLREWFKTGNRICPRTNVEVLDVQLARLPWLKHKIRDWCKQNGVDAPVDDATATDKLRAVHPSLPGWIADIRSDSGQKRVKAAGDVYELMRQWEASDEEAKRQSASQFLLVRDALLDDMAWLLRYGDPYLQGVAASILSYCDTPDEVQWLAPTVATPAVMLCLSPNNYTSQAATRLLYNIARAGSTARRTIHLAGGVQSLIKIISTDRQEYGYSRDRAAATIAILAKDPHIKVYLQPIALAPLKAMLLNPEVERYEKRDAATALLSLQYPQDDLGSDITVKLLFQYFWCSRMWLEGRVNSPDTGYTEQEMQARTNLDFWQENAHALVDQLLARDIVIVEAGEAGGAGAVGGEADEAINAGQVAGAHEQLH